MIRIARSILLGFACALLAACSTIPSPNTADDCLVYIKTETSIGADVSPAIATSRYYQLQFNANYDPVFVGDKYSVVRISEPGVKIKGIETGLVSSGYIHGEHTVMKADLNLPYQPGHVVVADFIFIKEVKMSGSNTFFANLTVRAYKPGEREALQNEIKDDGKFDGWKR